MEGISREHRPRRSGKIPDVKTLTRLYFAAPPFLLAAFIFYSSGRPIPRPVAELEISDKLLHVAAYAVLAFLVSRWLGFQKPKASLKPIIALSVVISGFYGVTDEFHQSFVPSRNPDVLDAVADFIGAALGAPWGVLLIRRFRK